MWLSQNFTKIHRSNVDDFKELAKQVEGQRVIKARADSQKGCEQWVAKAEAAAAAAAAKRMKDLQAEGQQIIKARAETEKACAAWLAKAEKAEAAAAAEAAKLISA